jgi:hypothetical protein
MGELKGVKVVVETIGIPLFGKMAFRTFHGNAFVECLRRNDLNPVYITHADENSEGLKGVSYLGLPTLPALPRIETGILRPYRRFVTRTETTELSFRDCIYQLTSGDKPLGPSMRYLCALLMARHIRIGARLSVEWSRMLSSYASGAEMLRGNKFRGLLVPGVGSFGFDYVNSLVYEAQRQGLAVISCISNYDNICSRGYRGYMPDRVAVWSQLMADDVHRLNDVPRHKIVVTGPVQFDRYFKKIRIGRDEFLRERGLDPARKTVIYAGSTNTLDLLHFMRVLIEGTRERCGEAFNVILRPHPDPRLMRSPAIRACIELAELRGDIVYVSDPGRLSSDILSPDTDLDELCGILIYSDVLINHYSTLGLEAAVCDLPTIYIDYDLYPHGFNVKAMSWWYRKTTHNRRFLRLRAARVVHDDNELLEAVMTYAADRNEHAIERQEYALSECGYLDGKSTERLATLINETVH